MAAKGDSMTERSASGEGWSALLDDEVDDVELGKLLDESSDPQTRQKFQRYQIARASMRGENIESHAFTDLSMKIRAALEDESMEGERTAGEGRESATVVPFKPREKREKQKAFSEFWKSMGSLAIAASVAGVVVLGARYLDTPAGLEPSGVVAEAGVDSGSGEAGAPQIIRASSGTDADTLAAEDLRETRFILRASDPRISDYQRRHLQFSAQAGSGGMMPFARVVSLEADQRQ